MELKVIEQGKLQISNKLAVEKFMETHKIVPAQRFESISDILQKNPDGTSKNFSIAFYSNKLNAGDLSVSNFLLVLFNDLTQIIKLNQNVSEKSISETIRLVKQKYYFLTPDDFLLWKDKLIMQEFGPTYNRSFAEVIFDSLANYVDQRFEEAERIAVIEKKKADDLSKSFDAKNLYANYHKAEEQRKKEIEEQNRLKREELKKFKESLKNG